MNNTAKDNSRCEADGMSGGPQDLPRNSHIRRILVMKWGALGDLVISTAMFSDIRQAFPEAIIDLQTLPSFSGLFVNDRRFNHVYPVDVRAKNGVGLWRWLGFILSKSYDAVFDFQSNDRSQAFMAFWLMSGRAPRWRVGNHMRFPYNIAGDAARGCLHAFDLQRETLKAAGVAVGASRPQLYYSRENEVNAKALMASHGLHARRFAVFFPGSQIRGLLKRWGSERYASLARELKTAGVEKVVLLGGPDDEQECLEIKSRCSEEWLVNLCGQTKVLDLIPLCDAAQLIVANDTGPAHVASSTPSPIPTIVICGPTDPRRVKPVGDNVAALQASLDCLNCYGKECSHHSCMKMVTIEMVINKFRDMGALT